MFPSGIPASSPVAARATAPYPAFATPAPYPANAIPSAYSANSSYPIGAPLQDLPYSSPSSQQLCYNVPLNKPDTPKAVSAVVQHSTSQNDYCKIRDKSTAKSFYLANSVGDIATCNTVPPAPGQLPTNVRGTCGFSLTNEKTSIPCSVQYNSDNTKKIIPVSTDDITALKVDMSSLNYAIGSASVQSSMDQLLDNPSSIATPSGRFPVTSQLRYTRIQTAPSPVSAPDSEADLKATAEWNSNVQIMVIGGVLLFILIGIIMSVDILFSDKTPKTT